MNAQQLRDQLAQYRDYDTNINKIAVDKEKRLVILDSVIETVTQPEKKPEVKK